MKCVTGEQAKTVSRVAQLNAWDVRLYMFGHTYVILYFDPRIFVFARRSIPSPYSLNRILWFIYLFRIIQRNWIVYRFEFFCRCSKNLQLSYSSSFFTRISGGGKFICIIIIVIRPTVQYSLPENPLSNSLSMKVSLVLVSVNMYVWKCCVLQLATA